MPQSRCAAIELAMTLRLVVPLLVAAGFAPMVVIGCQTELRCEDNTCDEDLDPEARCEAGGGEWGSWDCGGAQHHCGLTVCETIMGDGCGCEEGFCWDGDACLPFSSRDERLCEAGGGSWQKDLTCAGQEDECDLVACLDAVWPGCRCAESGLCWNGETCIVGESFDDT